MSMETGYTKFMTDAEFKAVRDWVLCNVHSPSSLTAFFFLLYTGTPPVDTLSIKLSDFSHDLSQAHIVRQKTGRPYIIRIPVVMRNILTYYIKHYRHRFINGHIFFADFHCSNNNEFLQTSTLRKIMVKCRKELGLEQVYYNCVNGKKLYRISLYTLRHYVAEKLYFASNNDIMFVKDYLNHKKISTTQKYLRGFRNTEYVEKVLGNAWK